MARMLGKMHPSWCPRCHGTAGDDCPDIGKDTRSAKREEERQTRKEIKEQLER